MHIPSPLIAVAAVAFLLLLWFGLRGRGRRRDLMGPPVFPPHLHPPPSPASSSASQTGLLDFPPEAEAEIRELVRQRRKIEAIKRLRELRPMSLKDAKDHVERM